MIFCLENPRLPTLWESGNMYQDVGGNLHASGTIPEKNHDIWGCNCPINVNLNLLKKKAIKLLI